ncbi:MAG: hypothetical protein D6744_01400 [Planctomycetota bacterium]|nr:MAG: hypothetical protein D6744_01400 [Planctomycetota bacterium]
MRIGRRPSAGANRGGPPTRNGTNGERGGNPFTVRGGDLRRADRRRIGRTGPSGRGRSCAGR